jgi:predicted dehydrogenase
VTDTSPIRISFIGAGGICEQRHLPNLQQLPGVELVAVCNRSLESSQRSKEKWKFERAEADWQKVIDDTSVDAIFIGTWPYLHRELSLAALEAGKHVFCQARLCMDWTEAKQMAAAAVAHPQLVSMVCPSPFRVRWERSVNQVLASAAFGELHAVAVRSLSAANANPQQLTWREMTEYSGLNILQVGIYAETLQAWCGECETLSATTSIPWPRKKTADGTEYDVRVPQILGLSGRLRNGALINEFHSGLAAGDEGTITLFGSRGTCRVDVLAGRVSLQGHGETKAAMVDDTGDPWLVEAEFLAAVRAVRRGESWHVRPNFAEAARYMLKMQALHDSARTNSTVRLDQYEV